MAAVEEAAIAGFEAIAGLEAAMAGAGVMAAAFAAAFFSFLASFFVMAVDFAGAAALVVIWAIAPPDSARTAIDVNIRFLMEFSSPWPRRAARCGAGYRKEGCRGSIRLSPRHVFAIVGGCGGGDYSGPAKTGIRVEMPTPACRLYLVTPPTIQDVADFARAVAAAVAAGDVGALQIRLKSASDFEIETAVRRLAPICRAAGVALILNDRPALAAALDCDGVHVGQSDMPLAEARRVVGRERIIGVTCHDSRHLAMEAAEGGADYVAFGAFFPTATKQTTTRADPEVLEIWQQTMLIPCVAIGGITPETCGPLVTDGADFIAVSAAVWEHPGGPAEAVRAFNAAIAEGLAARPPS